MQIDLRTVSIKPLRQTFDNVAKRLGTNKPASRYQEGTLDLQANVNFHYRPLWDSAHEIFDKSRTAITMHDWYNFKDPRQFYYGTYTLARARMQEKVEGDFELVEERGLLENYPETAKKLVLELMLPLRHVEWAGNMNNSTICAYGYGTTITQPCIFQAMDHLGMAQYLTRIGLLFADETELEAAKTAWLQAAQWQELRRYVEDTLVIKDWFELFIAQNLVLDGILYPFIYEQLDQVLTAQAGPVMSMLTRFQSEWFAETRKWVDASVKTAASESAENQAILSQWTQHYRDRALAAFTPLINAALGENAPAVLEALLEEFNMRATKAGLKL